MTTAKRLMQWSMRHWVISLFIALSAVFTIGLYTTAPQAEAAPTPASTMAQAYGGMLGSDASSVSSCALDQIGWLACPIIRAVAIAADSAFTFITTDFLVVDVDFLSGSSTTNTVWGIMRNFANILFVLFFLVTVYSLITGSGITNYDLKRLVPRLLIAAILVNISFFICQLAIDLITIMGASILDLIKSVLGSGTITGMPLDEDRGDLRVLGEIASQTLANTEVAWILLAPIVAVVFSSAIISSVILVILILRKVAIIALVLLAPIAFVAYLLPNTEQYFTKWMKMFIHLLLIFPIVALLLGTGQIVSAAIIKTEDTSQSAGYKQSGDEYTTTNGGGQASATLRLIAAGAAILPLAGTWYAFKGMTALMDSAGGKIKSGRRRNENSSSKDTKRREAAIDLNKKSQMMNGVNKIQQLTAMQDGGSGLSLLGRSGRRTYKKNTAKSAEQQKFDTQVQSRLEELRGKSDMSPQQNYIEALQRYQDKQTDISGVGSSAGDSLSINSYEGIDLKASEAYLLESLGKGAGSTMSNTNNIIQDSSSDGKGKGDNKSKSDNSSSGDDEKKAAGLSSLGRDGNSNGGGDSRSQDDSYRAPTANSQAALTNTLDSVGGAGGSSSSSSAGSSGPTVTVEAGRVSSPSGGSSSPTTPSQPQALTDIELKAKARAARYTSQSQEAAITGDGNDSNGETQSIEDSIKAQAGIPKDAPQADSTNTNTTAEDTDTNDSDSSNNESV